jgi:hypothetical protein
MSLILLARTPTLGNVRFSAGYNGEAGISRSLAMVAIRSNAPQSHPLTSAENLVSACPARPVGAP